MKFRKNINLASTGSITPRLAVDSSDHSASVGRFYDEHEQEFQEVYGDVIQAFRTTDISKLLNYQASAMSLNAGMKLLDAGCGVCGPAIYFAKHFKVEIDAVTASAMQAKTAEKKIAEAGLSDQVKVFQLDYHFLDNSLQAGSYDVVYFLESFGHSSDKQKVIDTAFKFLKPGGLLYIKDLFCKETTGSEHAGMIHENLEKINEAYKYKVADLYEVLSWLRRKGFILSYLKTVDIALEDFENLSISNEFQDLTGINRIDSLQDYIFPVDFFEIACIKPWYNPTAGNSRYFLQNLYHLQVLKRSENEL
ncbi:MAG: class I SAM-dependent methyltransferase [Flavitalea sp.]